MEASEEAADAVEEVADRVEALENGHNAEAAAEGQGSVELGAPEGACLSCLESAVLEREHAWHLQPIVQRQGL